MTNKLQPVRGTHDILPDKSAKWRRIVEIARKTSESYGYLEIHLPIFEFTEVFTKTLGDTTDIVTKEMYSFADRGGESLTLRPELTAGIARSFISNGLAQNLPLRFFSYGPAFRYERPQKGRMRQFHQIDAEVLGIAEPYADIEVIALGARILKNLGLEDKVALEINSLGDSESRIAYRNALTDYYSRFKADLSEESQNRLAVNPMRILDSKDERDRKINATAPSLESYYNDLSRRFFDEVLAGLTNIGVKYKINPLLVRGLDYYCHTAFEFTTNMLGSQNAVLAGGRYDKLIGQMGGVETPAIGFASGVERLIELSDIADERLDVVAILPLTESDVHSSFIIAETLRDSGIRCEIIFSGNLGKKLKKADKMGAFASILVGGEELERKELVLRDMLSGEQEQIKIDSATQAIQKMISLRQTSSF